MAVAVRVKFGKPILFRQERPGQIDKKTGKEKCFVLYKFRTMSDDRDENGILLPDTDRLTSFGRWLRKTSLDEIPELFNILKGDMSFVGPRPLLLEYLPYYTSEERTRHITRPGLTGLAQINGRNCLDWTDRFALDIEYVRNVSLKMDLRIIFNTIKKVMTREGVLEDTSKKETNFAVERKAGRI